MHVRVTSLLANFSCKQEGFRLAYSLHNFILCGGFLCLAVDFLFESHIDIDLYSIDLISPLQQGSNSDRCVSRVTSPAGQF